MDGSEPPAAVALGYGPDVARKFLALGVLRHHCKVRRKVRRAFCGSTYLAFAGGILDSILSLGRRTVTGGSSKSRGLFAVRGQALLRSRLSVPRRAQSFGGQPDCDHIVSARRPGRNAIARAASRSPSSRSSRCRYLLLLLGILQFGIIYNSQVGLTNAIRDAARFGTGQTATDAASAGTLATATYNKLASSLPKYVSPYSAADLDATSQACVSNTMTGPARSRPSFG